MLKIEPIVKWGIVDIPYFNIQQESVGNFLQTAFCPLSFARPKESGRKEKGVKSQHTANFESRPRVVRFWLAEEVLYRTPKSQAEVDVPPTPPATSGARSSPHVPLPALPKRRQQLLQKKWGKSIGEGR
jgi:hypothetical protein